MFGSQAATLRALAESPAVIKVFGIAEERQLIVEMIERMIGDLDALDQKTGRGAAELIIANIRAEVHRKDFGP
jgi:hypothetical protein